MDSTWKIKLVLVIIYFLCIFDAAHGGLEPGIFKYKLSQIDDGKLIGITKSLLNRTNVIFTVKCFTSSCRINLEWVLRYSDCDNAFIEVENYTNFFSHPESSILQNEEIIRYQKSYPGTETCDHKTMFQDQTYLADIKCYTVVKDVPHCFYIGPKETSKYDDKKGKEKESKETSDKETNIRRKREVYNRITQTWQDGRYLFVFRVRLTDCESRNVEVIVKFQKEGEYLSATQRPLLTFYAVMCVAFTILAFIWLIMMAIQRRDILRIHLWVFAVLITGLLEKVVFYSAYHHMNTTGEASPATLVFAELVSCLKRTVARMLLIIVSMGFGITKVHVGPQLHRVMAVGFLFFILSFIEAFLYVQGKVEQQQVSSIPLAVLELVIIVWIYNNLMDTRRTLKLLDNGLKLGLYRIFTISLILSIIKAVIFLAWTIKEHALAACVTRWYSLWLDDAFWKIHWLIIFIIMMIIWLPARVNKKTFTDENETECKVSYIKDTGTMLFK